MNSKTLNECVLYKPHIIDHFGIKFSCRKGERLTVEEYVTPHKHSATTYFYIDWFLFIAYKYLDVNLSIDYLKKVIDYLKTNIESSKAYNRRLSYSEAMLDALLKDPEKYVEDNPEKKEIETKHFYQYDFEHNILGKRYSSYYYKGRFPEYAQNWCNNINFFNSLSREDFDTELDVLLARYPGFKEITDLNNVKPLAGYYILVLDDYKQMYIGQSSDVRHRILQHWKRIMPFDRRIWGGYRESKISIDSFGPLDTTRIFVYHHPNATDIDFSKESEMINFVDRKYLLNRDVGVYGNSLPSKYRTPLKNK